MLLVAHVTGLKGDQLLLLTDFFRLSSFVQLVRGLVGTVWSLCSAGCA